MPRGCNRDSSPFKRLLTSNFQKRPLIAPLNLIPHRTEIIMLTVQNAILIVGIGLTLLSLCSGLPNVNDVEAKRNVLTNSFQHAKRQFMPADNGTCLRKAAESSVTIQACFGDTTATLTMFCSSTCNAVYTALVNCYGAPVAKSFYSTYCLNGYQVAAASHVTLNFAVVLMSVFIAAVLKITG